MYFIKGVNDQSQSVCLIKAGRIVRNEPGFGTCILFSRRPAGVDYDCHQPSHPLVTIHGR